MAGHDPLTQPGRNEPDQGHWALHQPLGEDCSWTQINDTSTTRARPMPSNWLGRSPPRCAPTSSTGAARHRHGLAAPVG